MRTSIMAIGIVIGLSCIIGCQNKTDSELGAAPGIEKDSVFKWLNAAMNVERPMPLRKELVLKAYRLAKSTKDDSTRLRYLSKIQFTNYELDDSVAFRSTNRETKNLAVKLNDSMRLASTHWDLGAFLESRNIKDSAFYHYAKAEEIFNLLGNKLTTGELLLYMASIQEEVKDYAGSEQNAFKAIQLIAPFEENTLLYNANNLLGILAKDVGDYDRAISYYNSANDFLAASEFRVYYQPIADNNIGAVYLAKKDYEKARTYFQKVVVRKEIAKLRPDLYAKALNNLAECEAKLKNNRDAENLFEKALGIRDSIGDYAGVSGSHYGLAEYYLGNGDTAKSLENASNAKYYSKLSSNNDRLLQSLELLARLDGPNASAHLRDYIKLDDSLQLEESKLRDKFARIRFETQETIEENRLLERQTELWIGIAVTLLLLALAFFVILDQRSKNQKLRFQREQQVSNEKIFSLLLTESQKVEQGKKIEQKRISEELHDGIQGRLQGVRMVLLGLNKRITPEAIAERGEAIKELMDIQEEVRAISHELSHSAYQKIHNFVSSIKDILNGIETNAGLHYAFEYDDHYDWDALNGDIKINLYRIIQESLQNCVKHAQAKNLFLGFEVEDDQMLKVTIADDGVGFVNKRGKKGIGLKNIDSRVEKLGGTWDIESAKGKGANITIMIPLRKIMEQDRQEKDNKPSLQQV